MITWIKKANNSHKAKVHPQGVPYLLLDIFSSLAFLIKVLLIKKASILKIGPLQIKLNIRKEIIIVKSFIKKNGKVFTLIWI